MAMAGCLTAPHLAAELDVAEWYSSVAGLAGPGRGELDPARFLDGLSSHLRRLIDHDRLVLAYLEEGGRTLSVYRAPPGDGPLRHDGQYTVTCQPGCRYARDEIGHASVFAGQPELVRDYRPHARVAGTETTGQCVLTAGLRSWLALPLWAAQRVSGALVRAFLESLQV
jgi:hypothetical protein